ncbi:hypothetical protein RUMGNA_02141 [Mediterraneibacter gnavus ATCC 29149]|uniref:Uncharacterized protein n=1 Tax=Mediterraneibacter gnavus (strain ATCC 29149 / DSM 114966 / JCM 6515 / VPI C7-9) TaxID=411470 RepID=A7B3L1_MEDG7|nr:hypothetical protein RUMGNA_02141 [Mediterraneibacter gnavus ATCC 29149]
MSSKVKSEYFGYPFLFILLFSFSLYTLLSLKIKSQNRSSSTYILIGLLSSPT